MLQPWGGATGTLSWWNRIQEASMARWCTFSRVRLLMGMERR